MKRREFIMLVGVAAAQPFAAFAQQPRQPVIGFLHVAAAAQDTYVVASFRRGLKELGYTEGENITIEYRWAEGQYNRLLPLAADLVAHHATVILAGGGNAPAKAAETATGTTPIVFVSGDDPVQAGLVRSLNHPEGNVTGVAFSTVFL